MKESGQRWGAYYLFDFKFGLEFINRVNIKPISTNTYNINIKVVSDSYS